LPSEGAAARRLFSGWIVFATFIAAMPIWYVADTLHAAGIIISCRCCRRLPLTILFIAIGWLFSRYFAYRYCFCLFAIISYFIYYYRLIFLAIALYPPPAADITLIFYFHIFFDAPIYLAMIYSSSSLPLRYLAWLRCSPPPATAAMPLPYFFWFSTLLYHHYFPSLPWYIFLQSFSYIRYYYIYFHLRWAMMSRHIYRYISQFCSVSLQPPRVAIDQTARRLFRTIVWAPAPCCLRHYIIWVMPDDAARPFLYAFRRAFICFTSCRRRPQQPVQQRVAYAFLRQSGIRCGGRRGGYCLWYFFILKDECMPMTLLRDALYFRAALARAMLRAVAAALFSSFRAMPTRTLRAAFATLWWAPCPLLCHARELAVKRQQHSAAIEACLL